MNDKLVSRFPLVPTGTLQGLWLEKGMWIKIIDGRYGWRHYNLKCGFASMKIEGFTQRKECVCLKGNEEIIIPADCEIKIVEEPSE